MLKRSLPPSSFTAHPSCPASQVAQLPLTLSDGRWHHICITWTTRDGFWEAYQDGERLGTGDNLAPWHPIKPGGVIILGQEQVRKLRQPRVSMCALAPVCVCVFSPRAPCWRHWENRESGTGALLTLWLRHWVFMPLENRRTGSLMLAS